MKIPEKVKIAGYTYKIERQDGKVISSRLRITDRADRVGKTPIGQNVTGWVDKEDI